MAASCDEDGEVFSDSPSSGTLIDSDLRLFTSSCDSNDCNWIVTSVIVVCEVWWI